MIGNIYEDVDVLSTTAFGNIGFCFTGAESGSVYIHQIIGFDIALESRIVFYLIVFDAFTKFYNIVVYSFSHTLSRRQSDDFERSNGHCIFNLN